VTLVIRDKPLTLGRLRSSVVYRLGAVPRGDLAATYVEPAVADVDEDLAELTAIVLRRLEAQDRQLTELGEANERLSSGMAVLARKLRIACDAVAAAAELAEGLSAGRSTNGA
jgi:hypothetical protein